jgi:gp32 DNA binding protein like
MASLADIRARIAAQENKTQTKGQGAQSDGAIYAHWNMGEGTTATVRFLPDADSNNTFFWVERQIIKLPFNGVKGDSNIKQIQVQVPCVEMYGENCPILAEVRPWYKDETLKEMANKYWKKRSYLFQGFVRQNPIGDDKTPANPIRRFIISPQIFTIIKSSLMDPEMENIPTDYMNGLDFNIKKTSKGGYADYSTSNWARKETPLTEAEQAAITTHRLFNLRDFLPKKPSEAELRIIKEMFEASVDGRPYDNDKWGAYYRPYGLEAPAGTTTVTETKAASVPAVIDEDDTPAAVAPVVVPKATSSDKAQDILAQIRARQKTA